MLYTDIAWQRNWIKHVPVYGSIVARSYDKSEALIILELYQMLFSFN